MEEQLFILMTLPTAQDSSLIDPLSEDLACSLGTETAWGLMGCAISLGQTLDPQEKKKQLSPVAIYCWG